MNWIVFAGAVVAYLVVGALNAWFLNQTPYRDNPLWVKILLWPSYSGVI